MVKNVDLVVWDWEAIVDNGESHLSLWAEFKLLETKTTAVPVQFTKGDDGVSSTGHVVNVGGGVSGGVGVEETLSSEGTNVGFEVLKVGVGAHCLLCKKLIKL